MSNIWFISDTHGFHKNICRGTSEWDKGSTEPVSGIHGIQTTRDFKTLEEMNKALIDGINKYVKEGDVLYHLGDFTFQGIDKIWLFRKAIICRNVHIMFGNHDHHIEANKILPNCHTNRDDWTTIMDGPNTGSQCWNARARDLFASAQSVKTISVGSQEIFMSHYAHRVWNRSHKGAIHLYGHSHDSLDRDDTEWGKSMDVGVDSTFRMFGEYRPFSLTEVMSIMSKRRILFNDHHSKHTN